MSTELSTSRRLREALGAALWTSWFPSDPQTSPAWARWLVAGAMPILNLLSRAVGWTGQRRQGQQMLAPQLERPVLGVGGWVLGGSGKTPACLTIAAWLQARGHRPAILSRGYGREVNRHASPLLLLPDKLGQLAPSLTGDEPWLLGWRLGCPIAIHPDRYQAAQALLAEMPEIDCFLLDDGLSQTSLRPSQRLLVVDDRLLGNQKCLPAGPLRADWPPLPAFSIDHLLARGLPVERAETSLFGDQRLAQASSDSSTPSQSRRNISPLHLKPVGWVRPERTNEVPTEAPAQPAIQTAWLSKSWEDGSAQLRVTPRLWAIAGIARPDRFFQTLRDLGLSLEQTIALPDHVRALSPALQARARQAGQPLSGVTLLMTEKDGVKFFHESQPAELAGWWALRMESEADPAWLLQLETALWPN